MKRGGLMATQNTKPAKKAATKATGAVKKQVKETQTAINKCTSGCLVKPGSYKKACKKVEKVAASPKNIKVGEVVIEKINIVNENLDHIMEECVTRIQTWKE
jgi:hypothetical protein